MGRVESKTKAQLLEDLAGARKRLAELEASLAEKKQTEEALREAEDRYRALFERAADSIILFDAETAKPVAFNDRACAELDYTREEMNNLRLGDLEAKESISEIRHHFGDIIKNGSDTFETLVKAKDGEVHTSWTTAKSISIGGKVFIQAIARDITDRKRMEEALRFSQDRGENSRVSGFTQFIE